MIFADGTLGLVMLALWIFCIIDVITTDQSQMRNLPKLTWLFIVIILPDIGSIAWLVAGRDWQKGPRTYRSNTVAASAYPEYDRPGRHVPQNADDDDLFLAQVKARAEKQRRDYQERRAAELAEEENRLRAKREKRDEQN